MNHPQSQQGYPQSHLTPTRPPRHVALAWVGFALGLAGTVLIPVPILNNVGALMGVAGLVIAFVALFGTKPWLAGFGLALAGIAIVGTLAIQKQWAEELDQLQDQLNEHTEQLDDCADQLEAWDPTDPSAPAPDCEP